jgi:phosphate transport system protein
MRNRFDQQLETLHQELIGMGAMCQEAIAAGAAALLDHDPAMAEVAIAREVEIDRQEREIESLCMRLLLQQQPVARDLRTVSSALKMIGDMERIGDQAADIAEISRHLSPGCPLPGQIHIRDMAQAAARMVDGSVDAFVKKDLQAAQDVIQYDDIVDELFVQVKDELTELIRQDAAGAWEALDLLMAAKYLERIGDHAVNLAERVSYSITGRVRA